VAAVASIPALAMLEGSIPSPCILVIIKDLQISIDRLRSVIAKVIAYPIASLLFHGFLLQSSTTHSLREVTVRADADTSPRRENPEWHLAGYHLPERHAQRVEVGADVNLDSSELLRASKIWCTNKSSGS
jgi:hypothetical protein